MADPSDAGVTADPDPDPLCVCGHPKSGHVPATPTQLVCVAVGMDCPCLDYEPEPQEPPC
jgi:hypothetical protein